MQNLGGSLLTSQYLVSEFVPLTRRETSSTRQTLLINYLLRPSCRKRQKKEKLHRVKTQKGLPFYLWTVGWPGERQLPKFPALPELIPNGRRLLDLG